MHTEAEEGQTVVCTDIHKLIAAPRCHHVPQKVDIAPERSANGYRRISGAALWTLAPSLAQ